MDFVDDHGVDVAKDVASFRRQNQIERFGCRDQNVGRRPGDSSPFGGIGISAANRDGRQSIRNAGRFGCLLDADQWPLKVSLDIGAKRLQRRNVEHGDAAVGAGGRSFGIQIRSFAFKHQPVDRHQKRGQRLAGTGWGEQKRVLAAFDGWPGFKLCPCRFAEFFGEPFVDNWAEEVEHRIQDTQDEAMATSRDSIIGGPLTEEV